MIKTSLFQVLICFFCFLLCFPLVAQKNQLDDLLDMTLEQLANIQVVIASKTPQKITETPATVRVITADQIYKRGYFTLEEALSDLPGFQFRNINSFNSYVFLRGAPSQNNLILILLDGIQINELNSGGFYAGGQYNLDNVERIEVMYGPASALYGTNAISGIVNIITKKSKASQNLNAGVLYGTFKTSNLHASYGQWHEAKAWGWRVSGMVKSSDKADLAGEKGDNNWTKDLENNEKDVALDGQLMCNSITVGFNFQNKQASAATYNQSTDSHYLDFNTFWNIVFLTVISNMLFDFTIARSIRASIIATPLSKTILCWWFLTQPRLDITGPMICGASKAC